MYRRAAADRHTRAFRQEVSTQNFPRAAGLLVRSRLGVTQRYQQTAYAVWDVQLTREVGRLRPFLQMSNLANTGYQELIGIRMPGRSFTGGVEIQLSRHTR